MVSSKEFFTGTFNSVWISFSLSCTMISDIVDDLHIELSMKLNSNS